MVHVHDPRVRWSVRAAQVVRIVAASEWSAAPAFDTAALLGGDMTEHAEARRVVVARVGDREVALLAAGSIDITEVDPGAVLVLPEAFATSVPQIAGIIVAADASLSLLLEPSAVTRPEDSVSGEELCPRRL
jgi:chemotaxis signal transduction protein